ncbi:MAG: hypothetical protein RRB13_14295 [bacterium]|nr:hypothetical protein [bacterium]
MPTILLLFFVFVTGFSSNAQAQLNLDQLGPEGVDLSKVVINKELFLDFVGREVAQKKPGLGTYGKVELDLCSFPVNGRPLKELKTLQGKSIRLFSNPSCEQWVLRQLLDRSYGFSDQPLSTYQMRRCISETTKAFSPMMEYYTVLYEVPVLSDCAFCEIQKKRRLSQIQDANEKVKSYCEEAVPEVQRFLQDLSGRLDQAFKLKAEGLKAQADLKDVTDLK